jgi:hypothetical protein
MSRDGDNADVNDCGADTDTAVVDTTEPATACESVSRPDVTAPSAPGALTQTSSSVTTVGISWTASGDDVAVTGYDVFLDGVQVGTGAATVFTFTGLHCGQHATAGVEAFDAAGNRSTRATLAIAAAACPDTVAPKTSVKSGPSARTTSRTARFTFASNEAGSTFQCKLDRGAFVACRSAKTYRKLRKGQHTFQVRAKDRAGNLDKSPAKKTWRIR